MRLFCGHVSVDLGVLSFIPNVSSSGRALIFLPFGLAPRKKNEKAMFDKKKRKVGHIHAQPKKEQKKNKKSYMVSSSVEPTPRKLMRQGKSFKITKELANGSTSKNPKFH
ncbi:hypothetical protein DH2020_028211 [Rehmannia glutinosa]|uniref:Uncharacterized protein n=1 Tax=Rehmannia glutinosa TaxID=99300 RepID=A0ABR0VS34_REHGL